MFAIPACGDAPYEYHVRLREKRSREKRKAKKLEENGVNIFRNRVCAYCGDAFISKANHQMFCTPVCRKANETDKRHEKKAAEKSTAFSIQKNCIFCGKLFTAENNKRKFCSEECSRQHHNEVSLDWYLKKKKTHPYPEKR